MALVRNGAGVSTAIIYAVAEPDDIKAGPRGRFEKVGAGAMSDREQELLSRVMGLNAALEKSLAEFP
jgi:hypothetical protein